MSNKPNKKRIGLFLLIGLVCLTGLIGKMVIDKVMPQNNNLVVMFFNESVKGLSVGSPVVLEGVEVGKVARISLVADLNSQDFRIPVYMRFANNLNVGGGLSLKSPSEREIVLKQLVDRGLRARLVSQNLLTGQLMIELVMLPDVPIQYVTIPQTSRFPQIPTTLSTIGELSKGIQDLPLRDMVYKLDGILKTLNEQMPIIMPEFARLGQSLNQLSDNVNGAVNKIDRVVPKTTQTLNHFNRTLDSISQAAKSMRQLLDYLERHPESLLRGKGK